MHQAGRIFFVLPLFDFFDPTYATMGLTALAAAAVSASLVLLRGLSPSPRKFVSKPE